MKLLIAALVVAIKCIRIAFLQYPVLHYCDNFYLKPPLGFLHPWHHLHPHFMRPSLVDYTHASAPWCGFAELLQLPSAMEIRARMTIYHLKLGNTWKNLYSARPLTIPSVVVLCSRHLDSLCSSLLDEIIFIMPFNATIQWGQPNSKIQ